MAETSTRRVVALAAVVAALVGGAAAGGITAATGADNIGHPSASPDSVSVATAPVVRTDLESTVSVGGTMGYAGSYTVAAPTGTSTQQVAQSEQAVAEDEQALSADEQSESDTATADSQQVSADQTDAAAARSSLSADQTKESQDCQGSGASTPTCSADAQKVSADQAQVAQADQKLAAAQSNATADHDQDQAKVAADRTKLAGDQATLDSEQTSELSPGTTYTWLPEVGAVIKEDQAVYSVSDEPVPLLYGSIPAYRAFSLGMSDGADVGQLTQDLIALGYGTGLAQSDHYSSATAAAVDRWQKALDLPVTGAILLGQVVFEPGLIRVTSVAPSLGEAVAGAGSAGGPGGGGGVVLTATGTTPVVTVALDVDQEYLVEPGDAVTVVLPDGTSTVGGHIEAVGTVATCPGGGAGSGPGAGSSDQSPCASGAANSTASPTVPVTVTLDRAPSGGALDQAPVSVDITTERAEHVLAVPVSALLALRGGGFGVEVADGRRTRLVGVTTGLYSNTLVQVSGTGIAAGMRVEVPSS